MKINYKVMCKANAILLFSHRSVIWTLNERMSMQNQYQLCYQQEPDMWHTTQSVTDGDTTQLPKEMNMSQISTKIPSNSCLYLNS